MAKKFVLGLNTNLLMTWADLVGGRWVYLIFLMQYTMITCCFLKWERFAYLCTSKFSYITSHDIQTIWSKSANAKQVLVMF